MDMPLSRFFADILQLWFSQNDQDMTANRSAAPQLVCDKALETMPVIAPTLMPRDMSIAQSEPLTMTDLMGSNAIARDSDGSEDTEYLRTLIYRVTTFVLRVLFSEQPR
jgi:hypothetical protein